MQCLSSARRFKSLAFMCGGVLAVDKKEKKFKCLRNPLVSAVRGVIHKTMELEWNIECTRLAAGAQPLNHPL